MKLKLKSQVTMLMIVGLAIFITVSLVLYISKSAIKKQSQQSIKKVQETAIDTQPIKEFVTKCLDKIAKDAIILLGRQGGYLYSSQGGTIVDYSDTDEGLFFVKYNGVNAAYNIRQSSFAPYPYSSDIPNYPWQTFPYQTASSNAEIFDGYFGASNLPPLNSSEGPNSIQTQIETFVDSNMEGCANTDIFENQGYNIVMNPPKTSVVIGVNGVSVKSTIPISISNPATGEFTSIRDFSADISVKMRDAYFFINELIQNDIKNIRFNISDVHNNKGSLSIRLVKNFFSDDSRRIKADLVVVTDESSLIYGKPFQYVFARRNRAPALYYIRQNIFNFPEGYLINQTNILPGQLRAEDPDEDGHTFSIFVGEFGSSPAQFPKKLNVPQIKFRVEVSDGKLSDYQVITVNRI